MQSVLKDTRTNDISESTMQDIIFVTASMCGGGTERVISLFSNLAVSQGMNATIMIICDDRVEYELDDRVKVEFVSKATGGNIRARISRIRKMRRIFKNSRDAGIIAMCSSPAVFTMVAAFGLKNKVIVAERNDPARFNLKPIAFPMKQIREFLYKRATKVVLQTEDSKRCFSKKVSDNSVIIMNPLSDDMFEYKQKPYRDKSIIFCGRLVEIKGLDILVDAFTLFHKSHPEYVLKLFGEGHLRPNIEEQIMRNGISDCAKLYGFTEDVYEQMLRGGMYLSTSNSEGISNAIMEAMCLGIPVLATDCPVGGSKMCIDDGVTGVLLTVDDVEGIAAAMCKVADDEEFRNTITSNAMHKAKQWTCDNAWKQWLELFE